MDFIDIGARGYENGEYKGSARLLRVFRDANLLGDSDMSVPASIRLFGSLCTTMTNRENQLNCRVILTYIGLFNDDILDNLSLTISLCISVGT